MTVSDQFKLALLKKRAAGVRLYRLAQAAGMSPSMLSAIATGAQAVRPNDPRVIRLGELIGVRASECFAPDADAKNPEHAA